MFSSTRLSEITTVQQLHIVLRSEGCSGCELGTQQGLKGPVVYRGNPYSRRMIIGEAPGANEDITGNPFTGPAGKEMDARFAAVGLDTNNDFYIGNCTKCRPLAPEGSGRQNLTPTVSQKEACLPYLQWEIKLIQPKIVVITGATAAQSILGWTKSDRITEKAGQVYFNANYPNIVFYVIYHPAFLLHSKGRVEQYNKYSREFDEHLVILKGIVDELDKI